MGRGPTISMWTLENPWEGTGTTGTEDFTWVCIGLFALETSSGPGSDFSG